MKKRQFVYLGITLFLAAAAFLVFYNTVFQNGVLLLFLQKFLTILRPVIYGVFMAYLLAPLVSLFERLGKRLFRRIKPKLCRALSILLTWLLALGLIYALFSVLLPSLITSLEQLAGNLETYYKTVYDWVMRLVERHPDISDTAQGLVGESYKDLLSWLTSSLLPQAQQVFTYVTGSVVGVISFFSNLIIGIAVSVYLLANRETFLCHCRRLLRSMLSEEHYLRTRREVKRIDNIFSGFVRGKLLDSLIIGILCFIFCSLFRFPYAPLVSVIVGVTNIIPFFGPFLGAIPSAFLILLVDPLKCLYFVIFIICLQQLDGNVIGPWILGDSTGISGFWIIVAILLGGGFFGVAGMFLGVPIFACIYASVSHFCRRRLEKKGAENDPELKEP